MKNESYIEDYVSIGSFDGWRGVKTFKGINVPVFANIKGIRENKKISPTFDVKAGFNLGIAYGLMGEVGAGCRFDLAKTALATTAFIKGAYEEESLVHCAGLRCIYYKRHSSSSDRKRIVRRRLSITPARRETLAFLRKSKDSPSRRASGCMGSDLSAVVASGSRRPRASKCLVKMGSRAAR